MRWEGAARRSEGSRAWGRKHCRGRDEGSRSNRSLRSESSQNEAVQPIPARVFQPMRCLGWILPLPGRAGLTPQPSAPSFCPLLNSLKTKVLAVFLRFEVWCIIKYIGVLVVISKGLGDATRGVCSSLGYSLPSVFVLFSCSRYRARLRSTSCDRVHITPRQAATKRG